MAFLLQNWARASVSGNEPITTLASAVVVGCFREYNYYTADTQAVVAASGYFNLGVAYSGVANDLVTGDLIKVYSTTDGSLATYIVTVTAGVVTVLAISTSVQASVTLTAAQVNGADAAPVQILPAPGAGRMYVLDNSGFSLVYVAQFANGGAQGLQYGNTAALGGIKATATLAGATFAGLVASSTYTLIPVSVAPTAAANMVNQGIFFSNDTAPFINGAGSTLIVSARARIVPAV